MAQFARPDLDTNNVDAYTDQGGGSTNLYTTIDEVSFSDADYIRTVTDPSTDVIVFRLSDVTDPVSSVNHVLRVRAGTDQAAGGNPVNLTAQLRMTYVSEGAQGTLIATLSQAPISDGSFTTYTYTLSGAEADAITDYTALFLRITLTI